MYGKHFCKLTLDYWAEQALSQMNEIIMISDQKFLSTKMVNVMTHCETFIFTHPSDIFHQNDLQPCHITLDDGVAQNEW